MVTLNLKVEYVSSIEFCPVPTGRAPPAPTLKIRAFMTLKTLADVRELDVAFRIPAEISIKLPTVHKWLMLARIGFHRPT